MFHLISYKNTPGGAVTDNDMTANVDAAVSIRNNHYFFTTPFALLGSLLFGGATSRGVYSSPTLNAYSKNHIWPINESITVPSPPRFQSFVDAPFVLPQNEEIAILQTTTGADTSTFLGIIAPQGWNRNIPPGISPEPILTARFTCTPTLNTQAYSALVAITIDQQLRGGTYAVVGVEAQATNLIGFRLAFNKPPFSNGVPLRPGSVASQSLGDVPLGWYPHGSLYWGVWGKFATTEYPMFEALGLGSATTAVEGRLYLVYLNDSVTVNYP